MSLFRPPIVRSAGAILDRSLFSKTVPIAAARVFNNKNLSNLRKQLERSKDILILERCKNVCSDPDSAFAVKGGKCILLKPEIKPEDPATWGSTLQEAVKSEQLGIVPFDLKFDYNYWTYCECLWTLTDPDQC